MGEQATAAGAGDKHTCQRKVLCKLGSNAAVAKTCFKNLYELDTIQDPRDFANLSRLRIDLLRSPVLCIS